MRKTQLNQRLDSPEFVTSTFVTRRDRLAWFGANLIQKVFDDCGVRVLVVVDDEDLRRSSGMRA